MVPIRPTLSGATRISASALLFRPNHARRAPVSGLRQKRSAACAQSRHGLGGERHLADGLADLVI
ncbi:hypothetical protein ASF53_09285 [Methylobacterium sp. Leaf123]|nr:hypothetical protein ASF53_09285 [Methylobacterium sp. Leaf123]